LRFKKCVFSFLAMEYFGYIVSTCKFLFPQKYLGAVADWRMPTTHKEVRSFVLFCNFYAKFIY
jgi:hypothetical protein